MEIRSFWREKKVLVTGATGLVGSWLVKELLKRGARVVALIKDFDPQSELIRSKTHEQVTIVNGKLEDYQRLELIISEHEIDTVFHLGAQTIVGTALRSPLATFEANIRGSYNLLEACRVHKSHVLRVIIASSDKAYGSSTVLPYTEEMPPLGKHPYDVSKSCVDLLAQTYFHTYGMPVAIARCGNIYGGGDLNWSRLIPGTIRSLLNDEPPVIRSDGKFTRDYVYVEDVVDAYLMMAEGLERSDVKGEAFNFGPDEPYSALQVLELIGKIFNKKNIKPHILNQAFAEIRDQHLSCQKAKKTFKWSPRFTLQEGLVETINWYEGFFKRHRKGSISLVGALQKAT
jgi:CDP-glucose 4,6-dehydratase